MNKYAVKCRCILTMYIDNYLSGGQYLLDPIDTIFIFKDKQQFIEYTSQDFFDLENVINNSDILNSDYIRKKLKLKTLSEDPTETLAIDDDFVMWYYDSKKHAVEMIDNIGCTKEIDNTNLVIDFTDKIFIDL